MTPPSRAPSAGSGVAAKTPAKKAQPKKAIAATKAAAKKTPPKKTSAKAPAPKVTPKAAPLKKAAPAAKAPAKKPAAERRSVRARTPVGPYATDVKFLEEQRAVLLSERAVYQEQADALRAEADSLAQEREPGDVQFDEESGEGGTVTVDRERDLALSAQATAAVEEIEDALDRIDKKTYGTCERCLQPILKARLRALPYARLCVACKSGGLSRR